MRAGLSRWTGRGLVAHYRQELMINLLALQTVVNVECGGHLTLYNWC